MTDESMTVVIQSHIMGKFSIMDSHHIDALLLVHNPVFASFFQSVSASQGRDIQ